ncbi:polysaccharide biosynthesis tyrosine autokinase [Qipengyuania sphaerica]|uniref:GumC family protein n=1 Tax=Qipengyuania sphaerica TaxID=2867243 RepID=UPI0031EF807D
MNSEVGKLAGGSALVASNSEWQPAVAENSVTGAGFDIDFRAIWIAIRRNLALIIAIMVLALGLGVVVTLLTVPTYVASSRVLVEQQTDQIIENAEIAPSSTQDADRFLQTQVDVIRSRSLAQRVVESEGLSTKPEYYSALGAEMPTEEDLAAAGISRNRLPRYRVDAAIDLLLENLTVNLPLDSRLVSISFASADPKMSADIANAVATNYIEANLARKFESSSYAREFLAQQLAEARAKLENSELELNQYSRVAGLIRVSGQGQNADAETTLSVTNDTLVQLNNAASLATAQRVAAENKWRNIANVPVLSVPQVLQNSAVQSLIQQRSAAEARLADERSRHLDEHPNVQALQAQVDRLNEQIQSVGNSIKNSVRLEYEAARDQENALQSRVLGTRATALDEQDRGVQYNLLKREAETDRALYNTLLTRFNELNATAGAASNNVSLVDVAEPPRKPSSPNAIANMLIALLGGLVFSAGLVFVRDQIDDVVRSPEDVERKLGVTLLGLVPRVQDGDPEEELLDPKSPVSEAYQSLVTNLRYSSAEGIPKLLVVTSSQAGEGKTTTSNQLAKEFAGLGRKTLLIDADLRRPTLHRRLDMRDAPGLTAVLAREKTVNEVLIPAEVPNLTYMTALPLPPAPSALLATGGIEALLDDLAKHFDCVILDAPPVLGLSDSPTLAAHADAVLMVVDGGAGRRGSVKTALRRLQMVNASVVGAVLTKFDVSSVSGEYSYYGSDYYTYESSREG